MSTLTVLDWDRLLATPDTRWYLDRDSWDTGQCGWQAECRNPAVAYVDYRVARLLGGVLDDIGSDEGELACSHHLPDLIAHATGEPLVAGTVVEVGVDPALLRLTGVDLAVQEQFNKHALGVAA